MKLSPDDQLLWEQYQKLNKVDPDFEPNGVDIVKDRNFKVFGYIHDWEYTIGPRKGKTFLEKEYLRIKADANFASGVLERGHPIRSVLYYVALRIGGWYKYYFS
jgi:hypothetical protein